MPASALANRKDSFESVWCDVFLWLERDSDATAKDLLARPRQLIRNGSATPNCERFCAERGPGVESRPRSWSTLLPMSP